MAKEKFSRVIDITVKPGRDNHPPLPKKVLDGAIKKAADTAKEEIKKYYTVENEPVDVDVGTR